MNRVKLLREEKNMLQEDLGKVIGVSGRAIGNYESEKRDMSTEIQKKLAKFFGVTIDYLVGNSDERTATKSNEIDDYLLKIGLDMKKYNPPSENQKKQIEEFAKLVLKDNEKDK